MKRTRGGTLGIIGLFLFGLSLTLTAAQAQTGPPAARPDDEGTYVVKKGDTLWGIARDLLQDPFLWPRAWEQNPFITDPNRIYPGDTLALPGRQLAPVAPAPVAEAPAPEPPKEAPKVEEVKAPPPAPPAPPPAPQVDLAPPSQVPPASAQAIACSPVLSEEAAANAGLGTLVKGDDDRLLLSQENSVFVGLHGAQSPRVGDRLAVIRAGLRVIHPRTNRGLGRILHTLGVLEVTEVRGTTVGARVMYSCDALSVGDRVIPFAPAAFPEDKVAQPTSRQVEGTVVDTPRSLQLLALQHLVFLDVGQGQGIGPGDVFAIYRPSAPVFNPGTAKAQPIPPERRGEAVVIRVTAQTATAVVTFSGRESQAGDRVVLSRQIQP